MELHTDDLVQLVHELYLNALDNGYDIFHDFERDVEVAFDMIESSGDFDDPKYSRYTLEDVTLAVGHLRAYILYNEENEKKDW